MKLSYLSALPFALALATPAHAAQPAHALAFVSGLSTSYDSVPGVSTAQSLVTPDDKPSVAYCLSHPLDTQCKNSGITNCPSSPENATLLLTLLAGGGLFLGSRMARAKSLRQTVNAAA